MSGTGTLGTALLVATLAVPLALLLACLSRRLRNNMPALLVLAPLPGLAAALLALGGMPLAFDQPQLGISLALDVPGALLLGVAALLWSVTGAYAFTDLRGKTNAARFSVCWLLTLTGSLGVFIVADLLGFYLFFALASLPAYGLIVHDDDDPAARRAGGVYMAFTVLSEAFLLLGFVLLAAGESHGSLQIRDVVAALPQSPWRDAALVFTVAGFALKIGTVPAHGWMPLTYAAAPIPAASVLSGAGVKAGVIGLIRFLPFDTAMPGAGEMLVVLGFFSAFYGVAIGITQANPKTVLAYSSVSQMGVIAAVLGMGLAAGDHSVALDTAFYAATHVLAKGALFLAVGVTAVTAARRLRPTLLLAAVLALGLGGLPLTGGALAKLAVKAPLGDGVVGLPLGDRHDPSHAAFLAVSGADRRARAAGAGRSRRALAGYGAGVRRRPLAALSFRRRQCRRCPCACRPVRRPLAGSDRRRAGARLAALAEPSAAHPRGRHRRTGRASLQRELRRRQRDGASRRLAPAMAGSRPVASGDCRRPRRGDSVWIMRAAASACPSCVGRSIRPPPFGYKMAA
jgi:formate hydrogenlyase subunit 3/multisubunit Na+/H+ antiporter MnhD subunit